MKVSKQLYYHKSQYIKNTGSARRRKIVRDAVSHIVEIASQRYGKKNLKNLVVLDVGSGIGEFTLELAKHFKKIVGVEPYVYAYRKSLERFSKSKYKNRIIIHNFLVEELTTKSKFDLVVSLTSFEHMPKARKSFSKIFKLMKPKALIYLTVPNKLWPIEPHYKLPFLSYLPLSLANFYVSFSRRGDDYTDSAYSRTYFGMKSFFDKFDCWYKFVLPDVNSSYLGYGQNDPIYNLMKKFGIAIIGKLPFFWTFSKGFIIVITKGSKKSG